MGANNVRSGECCGGNGSKGSIAALVGGHGTAKDILQRFAEKRFAGGSGEQWKAESVQRVEMREQGIIFVTHFAKAKSGIEHDAVSFHTGLESSVRSLAQLPEHQINDGVLRQCGLGMPVLRPAASMHQDYAALEFGARSGHVAVPEKTAHVVDDLRTGCDGGARGRGFVSVDGDDGRGTLAKDGFDYGKNAVEFFLRRDRRMRPWTCRFATDVEDVRAVIEQLQCVCDGFFRGKKFAALGERVWSNVDDASEQRPTAQCERAGVEAPLKLRARSDNHGTDSSDKQAVPRAANPSV